MFCSPTSKLNFCWRKECNFAKSTRVFRSVHFSRLSIFENWKFYWGPKNEWTCRTGGEGVSWYFISWFFKKSISRTQPQSQSRGIWSHREEQHFEISEKKKRLFDASNDTKGISAVLHVPTRSNFRDKRAISQSIRDFFTWLGRLMTIKELITRTTPVPLGFSNLNSHRKTDIRLRQRQGIVCAISSNTDNLRHSSRTDFRAILFLRPAKLTWRKICTRTTKILIPPPPPTHPCTTLRNLNLFSARF